MTPIPSWRRYLRFWRPNVVEDVEDELRFHTEMRVREFMSRGMSEAEARQAVRDRLGDVDAARDECIELGKVREIHARNADFLDGLRADLRYALRSLGRAPGWTAVALLTIGLGVGATTSVFSVADALLVRPVPYPDGGRVYFARRQFMIDSRSVPSPLPIAAVGAWRTHARSIESAVPYRYTNAELGGGQSAVNLSGAMIDDAFLGFAGAHPLIGRNFTREELVPGGPRAVLLAEPFWRSQYGASTDVIGKVISLDEHPSTIVGVVPASVAIPDFRLPPADVWLPLVASPNFFVNGVLVRIRPGMSAEAATAELDAILQHEHIGDPPRFLGMRRPGQAAIVTHLGLTKPGSDLAIRQALLMLTAAVALLLLVACTNVAHLLLARGATRQRELAVRHALGAARRRLLRQLVTESVVLALAGGALAVFVGWGGLKLLATARPDNLTPLAYVSNHRSVLTIASLLAIGCGLGIGLLAALRTAHRDLGMQLRASASSVLGTSRRLRASLVVGEVALSAILLVGALLLVHAVFDLQRTQLGFDARGVYELTFTARQPMPPAERASLGATLRARFTANPEIEGMTLAGNAPSPHGWKMLSVLETPERPATSADVPSGTAIEMAAPDYFSMLRMPFLAGRPFDAGSFGRHEVVISTSLERQLWPDGSAIGRRFRNALMRPDGSREPWQTVIGVVPDVIVDLTGGNAHPTMYQPLEGQEPHGPAARSIVLIVRLAPSASAARLASFVKSVAPPAVETSIGDVHERIDRTLAEPRFMMGILTTFAALGVVLAAIGLFGVISYSVGQRTREIGIRMALGASRGTVARLVVGDGVRLALAGIAIGLAGAVAATRLIENLLYGVSRFDPFSFVVGATVLLAVAIVACVVPMLRATGVDPAIAVRAD
jgi:putative ABC transport system permease protein